MNTNLGSPRLRIVLWIHSVKAKIHDIVLAMLPEEFNCYITNLDGIIDELVKNAIKANHKHIIIRERIYSFLKKENTETEAKQKTIEICKDMEKYNNFLSEKQDLLLNITDDLSNILRQESHWIDYKNKKNKSGTITEKDRVSLFGTDNFKKIFRNSLGNKIFVEFRAAKIHQLLFIEVINTAPILDHDLERITQKRLEFKKHQDAGTEYEFFIHSMDNSDGGSGLGYATIDSHLSAMDLEPLDSLKVITLHNTTIMVIIDLNKLKNQETT